MRRSKPSNCWQQATLRFEIEHQPAAWQAQQWLPLVDSFRTRLTVPSEGILATLAAAQSSSEHTRRWPIKSHYGAACAAGYKGPSSSDDEVWLRRANHSANDRGAQSDVGNPGLLW